MAKRLSEDEIKWILSVESSEAQQNIHKLSKENKNLLDTNKQYKKTMVDLVAQGKKNTQEYKNLSNAINENNKQIDKNRTIINKLTDNLDVNQLSMKQLRKRAKELQDQLDYTAQGTHPKEYAELERQLQGVRNRMGELKQSGKLVQEQMQETSNSSRILSTALGTFLGVAWMKFTSLITTAIAKIKEFVSEGTDMAASADGITRAFKTIDNGILLDNLRKATKNTVTELELMKAAVQAKDFRIPLEDLGKYLQFAQLKAQQTSQSVDYMTNSIVTGLGRKSLMILDNLGLSAAEINEEISKTGDFMKAVANIVDKQLAAAGDNYVSAADRSKQKTVELQNEQRRLGEIILPIKEKWDEAFSGMQVSTIKLIGWAVKHRAVIGTVALALGSYILTKKLAVLWNEKYASSTVLSIASEKLQALWLGLSRKALLAKLIAIDLYKGRCNLATAATEMFNLVLKSSPLGIVTTLITAAATAFLLFKKNTSEADQSILNLNKQLAVERASLNNIFSELKKTNPGTAERRKLIDTLNEKYPDLISNYKLEKASLNEITRAQNDANAALAKRIGNKMKLKAIDSYTENSISSQQNQIEYLMSLSQKQMGDTFKTLKPALRKFLNESSVSLEEFWKNFGKYFHAKPGSDALTNFREAFHTLRESQSSLNSEIDDINEKYDSFINSIKVSTELTDAEKKSNVIASSKILQLEREKENVQSTWLEDTEESIKKKNKEIERIDLLIKKYRELGKTTKDSSTADTALKNSESAHADEINQIRLTGQQKQETEIEINLAILKSDKEYYGKRLVELEKFKSKEQKASKHAEYQKLIIDTKAKLFKTEVDIEHQSIDALDELRTKDLNKEAQITLASKIAFTKQLGEKKITKEQHDMLMSSLEVASSENRLAIEERYLNDVNDLELKNGKLKSEAVKKANDAVLAADLNAATSRANQQQKLNDLVKDFKSQFKVTTVDEDYKIQKKVLDDVYQARLEMAQKDNLDTVELTNAYNRASEQLESEHQQRIQSIRDQYLISTQQERYDSELAQLKAARDQGLIVEEGYEKAVQNLKRDSFKKQFDYYSSLFSGAVQALQQAEMDNVDAKYDAEIEAAQGNAEEVARLEKEKAQKKLDIEKKYADVNFAIKASQIIADTAVSIMKALADLGPIAGPIAAALMGITGVAQLASANSERKKVKNMTLSGSSSSKSGARVATGREEGGKIDIIRSQDGKFFKNANYDPDARGFIDKPTVIVGEGAYGQSKEWVASNAAVENPTIAPFLQLLDKHQQAGDIATVDMNQILRQRMAAGYVSGGSISKSIQETKASDTYVSSSKSDEVLRRLTDAIIILEKNGISADVSLSDLEYKQKLRDRARSLGAKS